MARRRLSVPEPWNYRGANGSRSHTRRRAGRPRTPTAGRWLPAAPPAGSEMLLLELHPPANGIPARTGGLQGAPYGRLGLDCFFDPRHPYCREMTRPHAKSTFLFFDHRDRSCRAPTRPDPTEGEKGSNLARRGNQSLRESHPNNEDAPAVQKIYRAGHSCRIA
jgi:hypothetical protein